MDLEKFISETLISIKRGLRSANEESNNTFLMGTDGTEKISFDIAVIASKETKKKGSGGIKVVSVGVEGDLSKVEAQQYVSRIKFSVYCKNYG